MKPLEVHNLHFNYGKNPVLRGIRLELKAGEVLCVFGPNGCGKTTLIECLLGLKKPRSGEILLAGQRLSQLKTPEIARKIALVPQKYQHTFGYTVMEMVLMGRTASTGIFQSPGEQDVEIAESALKRVGMMAFRECSINQLSGGEMQLVMLARALAQKTEVIVFDEPTSHLDFRHELNVLKYMCRLVREQGMSLLMSTHFPNQALYIENQGIPTRVALMEDGVIYAQGAAAQTLSEENMRRVFKIETKIYTNTLEGQNYTYIMPVDFSNGGQWNETENLDFITAHTDAADSGLHGYAGADAGFAAGSSRNSGG